MDATGILHFGKRQIEVRLSAPVDREMVLSKVGTVAGDVRVACVQFLSATDVRCFNEKGEPIKPVSIKARHTVLPMANVPDLALGERVIEKPRGVMGILHSISSSLFPEKKMTRKERDLLLSYGLRSNSGLAEAKDLKTITPVQLMREKARFLRAQSRQLLPLGLSPKELACEAERFELAASWMEEAGGYRDLPIRGRVAMAHKLWGKICDYLDGLKENESALIGIDWQIKDVWHMALIEVTQRKRSCRLRVCSASPQLAQLFPTIQDPLGGEGVLEWDTDRFMSLGMQAVGDQFGLGLSFEEEKLQGRFQRSYEFSGVPFKQCKGQLLPLILMQSAELIHEEGGFLTKILGEGFAKFYGFAGELSEIAGNAIHLAIDGALAANLEMPGIATVEAEKEGEALAKKAKGWANDIVNGEKEEDKLAREKAKEEALGRAEQRAYQLVNDAFQGLFSTLKATKDVKTSGRGEFHSAPRQYGLGKVIRTYDRTVHPKEARLRKLLYRFAQLEQAYTELRPLLREHPQYRQLIVEQADRLQVYATKHRKELFETRVTANLTVLFARLDALREEINLIESGLPKIATRVARQERLFEGEVTLATEWVKPAGRVKASGSREYLLPPIDMADLSGMMQECEKLLQAKAHPQLRAYCLDIIDRFDLTKIPDFSKEEVAAAQQALNQLSNYLTCGINDRLANFVDDDLFQFSLDGDELRGMVRTWRLMDTLARHELSPGSDYYTFAFDTKEMERVLALDAYTDDGTCDGRLVEDINYLREVNGAEHHNDLLTNGYAEFEARWLRISGQRDLFKEEYEAQAREFEKQADAKGKEARPYEREAAPYLREAENAAYSAQSAARRGDASGASRYRAQAASASAKAAGPNAMAKKLRAQESGLRGKARIARMQAGWNEMISDAYGNVAEGVTEPAKRQAALLDPIIKAYEDEHGEDAILKFVEKSPLQAEYEEQQKFFELMGTKLAERLQDAPGSEGLAERLQVAFSPKATDEERLQLLDELGKKFAGKYDVPLKLKELPSAVSDGFKRCNNIRNAFKRAMLLCTPGCQGIFPGGVVGTRDHVVRFLTLLDMPHRLGIGSAGAAVGEGGRMIKGAWTRVKGGIKAALEADFDNFDEEFEAKWQKLAKDEERHRLQGLVRANGAGLRNCASTQIRWECNSIGPGTQFWTLQVSPYNLRFDTTNLVRVVFGDHRFRRNKFHLCAPTDGGRSLGVPLTDSAFVKVIEEIPHHATDYRVASIFAGKKGFLGLVKPRSERIALDRTAGRVAHRKGYGDNMNDKSGQMVLWGPRGLQRLLTTRKYGTMPVASNDPMARHLFDSRSQLIHLIGSLGADPRSLGRPAIQRDVETKLFRPGVLAATFKAHPQLEAVFVKTLKRAAADMMDEYSIPAALFLHKIAFRARDIVCEERRGELPIYGEAVLDLKIKLESGNEEKLVAFQGLVHRHFLYSCMHNGYNNRAQILRSYCAVRSKAPPTEWKDEQLDRAITRWMQGRLREWQLSSAEDLSELLNPSLKELAGVERANDWVCNSPVSFTCQQGSLTLRLDEGRIYRDGIASAIYVAGDIYHEPDNYGRVFGKDRAFGQFHQEGDVAIYSVTYKERDYQIHQRGDGQVFILGAFEHAGKKRWYQFQPQLAKLDQLGGLPVDLAKLKGWVSVDDKRTILLVNGNDRVYLSCEKRANGITNVVDHRGGVAQPLFNIGKGSLPRALGALEAPNHIRASATAIHLDRLGMTLVRDGQVYKVDRYPGYILDEADQKGISDGVILRNRQNRSDRLFVVHAQKLMASPDGASVKRRGANNIWFDRDVSNVEGGARFAYSLNDRGEMRSNVPQANLWLAYLRLAREDYPGAARLMERGLTDAPRDPFFNKVAEWFVAWKDPSPAAIALQLKLVASLVMKEEKMGREEKILGCEITELFRRYQVYRSCERPTIALTEEEDFALRGALSQHALAILQEGYRRVYTSMVESKWAGEGLLGDPRFSLGLTPEHAVQGAAFEVVRYMERYDEEIQLAEVLTFVEPQTKWGKLFRPVYQRLRNCDPEKDRAELGLWGALLRANSREGGRAGMVRCILYKSVVIRLKGESLTELPPWPKTGRPGGLPIIGLNPSRDGRKYHKKEVQAVIDFMTKINGQITLKPSATGQMGQTIQKAKESSYFKQFTDGDRGWEIAENAQDDAWKQFKELATGKDNRGAQNFALAFGHQMWKLLNEMGVGIHDAIGMAKLVNLKESPFKDVEKIKPGDGDDDNKKMAQAVKDLQKFGTQALPIISKALVQRSQTRTAQHQQARLSLGKAEELRPFATDTDELYVGDLEFRSGLSGQIQPLEAHVDKSEWEDHQKKLFGKDAYEQPHHIRRAQQVRMGYKQYWEELDMHRYDANVDEVQEKVRDRVGQLNDQIDALTKKVRAAVMPQQAKGVPLRPQTKSVPIEACLNLWENDALDLLHKQYGVPKERVGDRLSAQLEELDLLIIACNELKAADAALNKIGKTTNEQQKAVRWKALKDILDRPHFYKRGTKDVRQRLLLGIEREEGYRVRLDQLDNANVYATIPNAALQAELGSGKSTVIWKVVQAIWADGYHLAVLVTTEHDKGQAMIREDGALRDRFRRPVFQFLFNETSPTDAASLRQLLTKLQKLTADKGALLTTKSSIALFENKYDEAWLQLHENREKLSNANNEHERQALEKEQQARHEAIDIWSATFQFLKTRARALGDEIDHILNPSDMDNLARKLSEPIPQPIQKMGVEAIGMILMDPELSKASGLLANQQASALIQPTAHGRKRLDWLRDQLAMRFAEKYNVDGEQLKGFVAYITGRGEPKLRRKAMTYLQEYHHREFVDIVMLKEFLGQAFPVLTNEGGVDVGRHPGSDNVIPYNGGQNPLLNSNISDIFEWVLSLVPDYGREGITANQVERFVQEIKRKRSLARRRQEKCVEADNFKAQFGIEISTITPEDYQRVANLVNKSPESKIAFARDFVLPILKHFPMQVQRKSVQLPRKFKSFGGFSGTMSLADAFDYLVNIQKARSTKIDGQAVWHFIRWATREDGIRVIDESEKQEEELATVLDKTAGTHGLVDVGDRLARFTTDEVVDHLSDNMADIQPDATKILYVDSKSHEWMVRDVGTDTVAPYSVADDVSSENAFVYMTGANAVGMEPPVEVQLTSTQTRDQEGLAKTVLGAAGTDALVDAGEWLAAFTTGEVVDHLSAHMAEIKAEAKMIIFVDPKSEEWMVRDVGTDNVTPFSKRHGIKAEEVFFYMTGPDSRAKDAPVKYHDAFDFRFTVTIGDKSRETMIAQAENRARGLKAGQSLRFLVREHLLPNIGWDGDREDPEDLKDLAYKSSQWLIKREADFQVPANLKGELHKLQSAVEDAFHDAQLEVTDHKDREALHTLTTRLHQKSTAVDPADKRQLEALASVTEPGMARDLLERVRKEEFGNLKEVMGMADQLEITSETRKLLDAAWQAAAKSLREHKILGEEKLPPDPMPMPRAGSKQRSQVEVQQIQLQVETQEVSVGQAAERPDRPAFREWDEEIVQGGISGLWDVMGQGEFTAPLENWRRRGRLVRGPDLHRVEALLDRANWTGLISANLGVRPIEGVGKSQLSKVYAGDIEPITYVLMIKYGDQWREMAVSYEEVSQYIHPMMEAHAKDEDSKYDALLLRLDTNAGEVLLGREPKRDKEYAKLRAKWTLLAGEVDLFTEADEKAFASLFRGGDGSLDRDLLNEARHLHAFVCEHQRPNQKAKLNGSPVSQLFGKLETGVL